MLSHSVKVLLTAAKSKATCQRSSLKITAQGKCGNHPVETNPCKFNHILALIPTFSVLSEVMFGIKNIRISCLVTHDFDKYSTDREPGFKVSSLADTDIYNTT